MSWHPGAPLINWGLLIILQGVGHRGSLDSGLVFHVNSLEVHQREPVRSILRLCLIISPSCCLNPHHLRLSATGKTSSWAGSNHASLETLAVTPVREEEHERWGMGKVGEHSYRKQTHSLGGRNANQRGNFITTKLPHFSPITTVLSDLPYTGKWLGWD